MSHKGKESLMESEFKAKLNRMGVSLDRSYHPLNYYKDLYFEKSNAKNKITRNNTPFYNEQIMNKKRQRSSDKKNKKDKKKFYDEINEEQDEEEINDITNTKGIKTIKLIESTGKKNPSKKEKEKTVEEKNNILRKNNIKNNNDKLSSRKKEKKEIISHNYNLRSKPEKIFDEKNIIKFGAQNDINNKNILLNKEITQKDYYLQVNENNNINNETDEKPTIISKKKVLLKRQNAIINNEKEKDLYNDVDNKNIPIYSYNNESEIDNNNLTQEINSETSSLYSNTQSRFSRWSNYTLMSFSKFGDNIISMKNCVMNIFRRNAYLFPLVILIFFGIVFFLNEKYENFERNNIIIIFSVIMGLIILFNLIKYFRQFHKFKKIAKNDKNELIKLFESLNINKEQIGNKSILINKFIEERIKKNDISEDTYMKYVFPYLVKYLKKEGFYLEKQKKENNINEDNNNYWKEI